MTDAQQFVIIIPTKNRRGLLERALGSVLSQSYSRYRIVVINDGSTDGTREYLDAIADARMTVIHSQKSRGVNVARNSGLKTLQTGEWAIALDDDDILLPDALATIALRIEELPESISIMCFNTVVRTLSGEYVGGRAFNPGEESYDPSYHALMTGEGLQTEGDNRAVLRWTLFPKYLFSEDINGFEGEWWLLVGRDGIGIRYFPEKIISIDQTHEGEYLRDTAARRNPGSFVRAHLRILRDHKAFFDRHPDREMSRTIVALKLAVRALDPIAFLQLGMRYLGALYRNLSVGTHNKEK